MSIKKHFSTEKNLPSEHIWIFNVINNILLDFTSVLCVEIKSVFEKLTVSTPLIVVI